MKSIAVYCGSSSGNNPKFRKDAVALGKAMAHKGIQLVYGGAKVGIMGAVADGVLSGGGKVIGVLPGFLSSKEIAHAKLTELIVVESMHERKTIMHEKSDGVIALPGGFGTLEELFEMLTWAQLGLHSKPIGILNTDGYYDDLIHMIEQMTLSDLLKPEYNELYLVSDDIDDLLSQMENYKAPHVKKWIRDSSAT